MSMLFRLRHGKAWQALGPPVARFKNAIWSELNSGTVAGLNGQA
ncbi:hypothetical protein [Bacterioplanes sanyensis]|nr:hypothetical protein [Bacterioplanes sanyensis]